MMQNYAIFFEAMEILGKKWVVPLLMFLLLYEETNFSKIKKNLRLTSRALSKKLKLLETLGLVEKIVPESNKKVFYALSDKGREMSKMMLGFADSINAK